MQNQTTTRALEGDVKVVLKWFKDNKFLANSAKFQFMILNKITVNHSEEILNKKIASWKSVKLFKLNIDQKAKFGYLYRQLI